MFLIGILVGFLLLILYAMYARKKAPPIMAASSSQTPMDPFDVFISHRGVDMKFGFADFLYHALKDRGITCFLDKDELPKGDDVRGHMLEAARKARFQVPIFTEGYGTSDWCLDELVEIMDCKKKGTSKACPVFYDLKPEDLRKPGGPFAINFKEHIRKRKRYRGQERIERWKQALEDASWLDGFRLETYNGSQGALIEAVVGYVRKEIVQCLTVDPETGLVGLEAKVDSVLRGFYRHNQTSLYFVLICGIGGIGKTTLAREIFRRIGRDFKATSFIDSCGSEKQVQEQLCA